MSEDDNINSGRMLPVWGVFLKSPDGYFMKDVALYLAFSEEAAEAKMKYHALQNNNFPSQYRIRRVDQQEMDDTGRILYKGNDNDEGL